MGCQGRRIGPSSRLSYDHGGLIEIADISKRLPCSTGRRGLAELEGSIRLPRVAEQDRSLHSRLFDFVRIGP